MNITTQICGLVLLILLAVFQTTHKSLGLYKEKIFTLCVGVTIIGTILDIVSVIFINLKDSGFPEILISISCKGYLIYLVLVGWTSIVYIFGHLLTKKEHRKFLRISMLPVIVAGVIVGLLPVQYYTNGIVCYSDGPATYATYIVCGLEIILSLIIAIVNKKKFENRTFFAIILWMIIWIICGTAQFFAHELLLVSFAGALGMAIIYTLVETTEYYIDKRFYIFNSLGMMYFIEELKRNNEPFGVIEFSFEDSTNYDVHKIEIDSYIKKAFKNLEKHKEVMLFKNIDLGFLAVSRNSNQLHDFANDVVEACRNIKNLLGEEFYITYVESTYHFTDLNDLYKFFSTCHRECDYDNYYLVVDEQLIIRYKSIDDMKNEIKNAFIEDRFECYLQPIYSFEKKSFIAAEALCRLRNPDGSFIPPDRFIKVAEETGQINEIGEFMFEQVCNIINNTSIITLGIEYIEINLSVVQCEEVDLADRFIALAKKNNVNPKRINFEITESAAIKHKKTLEQNMRKMIDFGFSFSLDDFGKGESNLMYVIEMPVSIVKIDYDLTKEFFKNEKAQQVLRAVINMVHNLDLRLVIEGIESINELKAMCFERADYIQGYYFSKPIPQKEFISYIANYKEEE